MALVHYVIPDDVHRLAKARAAARGVTLKAFIIEAMAAAALEAYDPSHGRGDRARPGPGGA